LCCETSRLPYFIDNRLTESGEVVNLMTWQPKLKQLILIKEVHRILSENITVLFTLFQANSGLYWLLSCYYFLSDRRTV
jgi:hypothetical protein